MQTNKNLLSLKNLFMAKKRTAKTIKFVVDNDGNDDYNGKKGHQTKRKKLNR